MIDVWLRGLVRRRGGRLAGQAAGVAVAVALLASLGAFLAASQASMTERATRGVAVDWQVQVQPGADPGAVASLVGDAPGTGRALPVDFGEAAGLSATSGGSARNTGAAVLLGLPADYRAAFPDQIRTLAGADQGVLLAQQTAANLGATVGDSITVNLPGRPAARVPVDGVVDLPSANSLFQIVGAPPGSQPQAPPDNVVLLPHERWQSLLAGAVEQTHTQIHVARSRDLPAGPAQAYTAETGAARNLEADSAGTAVVGDNLGAALDAARSDAAYAQVLFLFLGLPGAVLAGLLTASIGMTGADRRRAEQALARTRGMTGRQVIGLAAAEAVLVGLGGGLVGLVAAAGVGWSTFGSPAFGVTTATAAVWTGGAVLVGLAIAAASIVGPARRDLRESTVAASRRSVEPAPSRLRGPWWIRYGVDVLLLAVGGLLVWAASANGYKLVLAPEGTPTISVSYWAFAGPALLWVGSGLFVWRIVDLLLRRQRWVAGLLRPISGGLSPVAAAMMARRRRPMARAAVLLGLSLAFAVSTATFNATYRTQAEVDALLTNGADVTVTQSPGTRVAPATGVAAISGVPGVRKVEPVQHRFAYIGADLQDIYGVRPDSISRVTALQDAYFQGGTARELMSVLSARPDSILVSAETVKDYQLLPGDAVTLRLPDPVSGRQQAVPFHYAGIVTEFPTAPKDSFFVANASYLAARTGSDATGAFLVDTGGQNVVPVADGLRARLGPTATVTDIVHTRSRVGSSLTAVDLSGLTRVELGFALLLAASAGGLVLFLGLTERRRTFAVTAALGASRRQVGRLMAAETVVLAVAGLAAGAAAGWLISEVLVTVLTGVFDPPPATATVPWPYLVATGGIATAALGVAAASSLHHARRGFLPTLKET